MSIRIVQFLAIVIGALALIPSGAHLAALPNKIGLGQSEQNWTEVATNWESLRRQWEYSHAANAITMLVALCLVTASALSWRQPQP